MTTVPEALIVSSLVTAAATGASAAASSYSQRKASAAQKAAQEEATAKQEAADRSAEEKRLEGLKTAATKTDYGNIWGTESKRYVDAAQKLSAGTGSFGYDDEDQNPFYTKGLL